METWITLALSAASAIVGIVTVFLNYKKQGRSDLADDYARRSRELEEERARHQRDCERLEKLCAEKDAQHERLRVELDTCRTERMLLQAQIQRGEEWRSRD